MSERLTPTHDTRRRFGSLVYYGLTYLQGMVCLGTTFLIENLLLCGALMVVQAPLWFAHREYPHQRWFWIWGGIMVLQCWILAPWPSALLMTAWYPTVLVFLLQGPSLRACGCSWGSRSHGGAYEPSPGSALPVCGVGRLRLAGLV